MFNKKQQKCLRCQQQKPDDDFSNQMVSMEDHNTIICNMCAGYEKMIRDNVSTDIQIEVQMNFKKRLIG